MPTYTCRERVDLRVIGLTLAKDALAAAQETAEDAVEEPAETGCLGAGVATGSLDLRDRVSDGGSDGGEGSSDDGRVEGVGGDDRGLGALLVSVCLSVKWYRRTMVSVRVFKRPTTSKSRFSSRWSTTCSRATTTLLLVSPPTGEAATKRDMARGMARVKKCIVVDLLLWSGVMRSGIVDGGKRIRGAGEGLIYPSSRTVGWGASGYGVHVLTLLYG